MLTKREEAGKFSQPQVAAFMGVTPRQVRNWAIANEPDGSETVYLGADVRAWIEERAYQRGIDAGMAMAPKFDDAGGAIDVELEKARKLKAERIGQEIKNAASLGELAPVAMLTATLGDLISHFNSHLESVPAVIKREWPEVPGHVLDGVERGIAKLRDTIADARIDFTDPSVGGGWSDGSGASIAGDAAGESGGPADGE